MVVTCFSDFNHEQTEDSDGDSTDEIGASLHGRYQTNTMRFTFEEFEREKHT
jgi:hypothetical protein